MVRWLFVSSLACACLNSLAQVDIIVDTDTARVAKVMVDVDGTLVGLGGWSRDTLSMKIFVDGKEVRPESRKGQRALKDATVGADEASQLEDLDRLMGDMVALFQSLPAGDSLFTIVQQEQTLWAKARGLHCGDVQTATAPSEKRQVLGCHRWASECRLEDLLALYDSLNK